MTLADQQAWLERFIADMRPIESEPAEILRTLKFMAKWEMVIRKAIADNKELTDLAQTNPAVSVLIDAFPTARVTISTREEAEDE